MFQYILILCFYVIHSVAGSCVFRNHDFHNKLKIGWNIGESYPIPYIDRNHYLVLGDLITETMGIASVYQDFRIKSCNQNLTITYLPITRDFSEFHDQQYMLITNPSNGEVLARIFDTLLGFNLSCEEIWYQINCNVCDGTCGNVNLVTLGISPLRLEFKVHQLGNLNGMNQTTPSALIIKSVCLK